MVQGRTVAHKGPGLLAPVVGFSWTAAMAKQGQVGRQTTSPQLQTREPTGRPGRVPAPAHCVVLVRGF